MLPVVIGTNPERGDWLKDCLASIRATSKNRRVLIHRDGGYELTALRVGIERFPKFLFLHDSCEILDRGFWDIVDSSEPTWLFGGPPMYLGIFNSSYLAAAIEDAPYGYDITKRVSINWEGHLPERLSMSTLWPEVHDGTSYMQNRHGRENRVLENMYLRKLKGNWGQT